MQRPFKLRSKADFDRLRGEGRNWRHPLLILNVIPNGLPHNRYGFITSRQLGGAVIRNRVRRVLREILRAATPRLNAGFDILLIARNPITKQPYNRIAAVVDELLNRANMWRLE